MRSLKKGEKFLKKQNPKCEGKKIFISIRPPRERDIQNIIIYTHHLVSFVFRVGTRERSARIFLSEKERERDALTFLLEREDAE